MSDAFIREQWYHLIVVSHIQRVDHISFLISCCQVSNFYQVHSCSLVKLRSYSACAVYSLLHTNMRLIKHDLIIVSRYQSGSGFTHINYSIINNQCIILSWSWTNHIFTLDDNFNQNHTFVILVVLWKAVVQVVYLVNNILIQFQLEFLL